MREEPNPSNGIQLSPREWAMVAVISVVALLLLSPLWSLVERFELREDYRVPEELSEDYWLFGRTAKVAARDSDLMILGDSVVWGAYVPEEETLSHHLSRPGRRCANLGLPGGHPAALEGLLRYHGRAVRGSHVLLHCNPLWVSSPRHDLSEGKESRFNHPRLVSQLWPRIPCYRAGTSERLGIIVTRRLSFSAWARHLQQTYFGGSDIPAWTLEHPHANPLSPLLRGPPSPYTGPSESLQAWTERGIRTQTFDWVDLETSLQWASFRRTIRMLQARHNRVLVLVGPFNEHMLTDENVERYRQARRGIEKWLTANGVPHLSPPALPSALYADASHPLAAGYAHLAAWCVAQLVFQSSGLLSL